jgi:putative flippase GtrA
VTLEARIRAAYDKHGEKLRFLVVGVWNTAFSVGVLWLLDHFIPYDAHSLVQKEAILIVNWVIGVTQNFFAFKLMVFRTKGNWLREYARMYVTYGATFVVQSVLILALSTWLGWSLFWSSIPTLLLVMIMSYFGHKYFTFRGRHIIEAIDAGETFDTVPAASDAPDAPKPTSSGADV